MQKEPLVSVVVTGLNEERGIEKCIHALVFDQTYRNYELTYVDGGSSDKTLDIVKYVVANAKRYGNSKTKIIIDKGSNPAKARNNGIKHSQGEIIAFIDADCVAPNFWLQLIVKKLSTAGEEVAGIGGPYLVPAGATKITKIIYEALNSFMGGGFLTVQFVQSSPKTMYVDAVPAGNSAYWKNVLQEVNFFNQDLRFCEDHDLGIRIKTKSNKKIIFDPELYVYHHSKVVNFSSLFKLMYNYGLGRVEAFFREKKLFSKTRMIPAAFIVVFASCLLLGFFFNVFLIIDLCLAFSYLLLVAASTIKVLLVKKDVDYVKVFPAYIVTHLAYGLGTLVGLAKGFPWFWRK